MQVTPEELGQLAGMIAPKSDRRASLLAPLEAMYAQASAKRQIKPPDSAQKISLTAKTVAAFQAPTRDDRFSAARKKLGLPEGHTNLLYADVLLTHSNKVMANEGADFLPTEVLKASYKSVIGQPIDIAHDSWARYWGEVTPTFDRHMRERHGDDNGICGFVYDAAFIEPDEEDGEGEMWIGVALWPRDFPEIASALVDNRESLGASFDLVFSEYEQKADRRIINDPTFFGGTILFRNRAGDNTTEVGSVIYDGQEVGVDTPAASAAANGGDQPMKTDNAKAAAQPAEDAPAATEASALAEAATQLASVTRTLETTTASLNAEKEARTKAEAELATVSEERDALKAELDEIKAAAEREKLTTERMAELSKIGAFAAEADETEAREKVGAMAEGDFALFRANHQIGVLTRRIAAAQSATEKASEAATPIVHQTGQTDQNPNSNVQTGPGIVHNAGTPETGGTGKQTAAEAAEADESAAAPQAGSLSSIASGAAPTPAAATAGLRAAGAKLREAFKSGQ